MTYSCNISHPAYYDPTAPEYQQDPFPSLHRLRESAPIHLSRHGWVLTRYADCAWVLGSPRFGMKGIRAMLQRQLGVGAAFAVIANRFHSLDPPAHGRLREAVAGAFTAARIAALRHGVEALANTLLDRLADAPELDLVEHFSYPLALGVFTQIMGLRAEDAPRVASWTDKILTLQGMFVPNSRTIEQGDTAAREFMAFARGLCPESDNGAGDDVVSALRRAHHTDQTVTLEEMAQCIVFLANAGHSTTRNLIGSAVIALLRHPEQWQALSEEPELAGEAAEEALRFDCSLVSTLRFAREETIVGGRRIAAGATVCCLLNAANRDPERFPDPDRFDLRRTDKKHLAFGGGAHKCLGHALARMQIEIALRTLVRRYPKLRLSPGRIEWRPGLYRGPARLHVVSS